MTPQAGSNDPLVTAFESCLFLAFERDHVGRVANGGVPKWAVKVHPREAVVFTRVGQLPARTQEIFQEEEVEGSDHKKRIRKTSFPPCLKQLLQVKAGDGAVIGHATFHQLPGALGVEIYMKFYLAAFDRPLVAYMDSSSCRAFRGFRDMLAARGTATPSEASLRGLYGEEQRQMYGG